LVYYLSSANIRLDFKKSPARFILRGLVAATIEIGHTRAYSNKLFLKEVKEMSIELKQNLKDLQLKFENLRGYL
jgi:hypothetical protein